MENFIPPAEGASLRSYLVKNGLFRQKGANQKNIDENDAHCH